MYLHLGQDTVVKVSDIVGIFDLENTSLSKHTRQFLTHAEKDHRVFNVSYEIPKSFIVCENAGKVTIYISQISTQTLLRRSGFMEDISNI